MKKLLKLTLSLILLGLAVITLAACSQWDLPYESIDREGYTVSVRFDANGGWFAGTKDVYVIDAFNPKQEKTNAAGQAEIALIAPDNPLRRENAFEISRTGYFLAGWYQTRELRTDEAGNALDDYGQLCSVTGKPQGYIYSGKWEFDSDRLLVDPNGEYSSETSVMTLYAGWIPYFTYEFYAPDASGTQTLLETKQMIELAIPEWNTETGRIDMKKFPTIEGKTFTAAYLSLDPESDGSAPLSGSIGGQVDYERGIASVSTIRIYTTWREGNWFRIYTPQQFCDNARPSGCYEIMNDLDFTDLVWPQSLSKNEFTGTILGGGHTLSGIDAKQADYSQIRGGLFGALGATARLENVTLENVRYTVARGSRMQDAAFGLLAGTVSESARLEGVSVRGELLIGTDCNFERDYRLGLLFGAGDTGAIDLSGIVCQPVDPEAAPFTLTVDPETHAVTLQKKA